MIRKIKIDLLLGPILADATLDLNSNSGESLGSVNGTKPPISGWIDKEEVRENQRRMKKKKNSWEKLTVESKGGPNSQL